MATLEIIIGIVFIFLLLSLMGTILQEFYSSTISLRGRLLLDGLVRLLEIKYKEDYQEPAALDYNSDAQTSIHISHDQPKEGHRFKLSGFLSALFSTNKKTEDAAAGKEDIDFKELIQDSKVYQKLKGRYFFNLIESLPSYLSAEQVMAIYEEVLTKEKYRTKKGSVKENTKCIRKKGQEYSCENWSSDLQAICKASLEENLDEEKKEIAPLQLMAAKNKTAIDFEQMMDRISEQFKRRLQASLFLIGLLIAIAFNADTLRIYRSLSSNPEALQAVLDMTDNFVNESRIDTYIVSTDGSSRTVTPTDTAIFREFQEMRSQISILLQHELQSVQSPLGLGWDSPTPQTAQAGNAFLSRTSWILKKIPGWLITALAISLGAPFWFDLLSRLVNIRNAGKQPEGQKQAVINPALIAAAMENQKQ